VTKKMRFMFTIEHDKTAAVASENAKRTARSRPFSRDRAAYQRLSMSSEP